MKNKRINIRYQYGLTTLILSSIILFATTIIVLYASKSVLLEQKIFANILRTGEAVQVSENRLNQVIADTANHSSLEKVTENWQIIDEGLVEEGLVEEGLVEEGLVEEEIVEEELIPAPAMPRYRLEINGQSSDKSSNSNLTNWLSAVPMAGNVREQVVSYPLIIKQSLLAKDNLTISNTHTTNSIWAGGVVKLGESLTSQTQVLSNLLNLSIQPANLISLSGKGQGNHVDVIANDFNLRLLDGDVFFENFMNESKWFIEHIAKNNHNVYLPDQFEHINKNSDLIWLGKGDEDLVLSNISLGRIDAPVIVIVDVSNASLRTRGKVSIHGMLYIMGNWESAGDISINGAVIVEGSMLENTAAEFVKTQINYQPSLLQFTPNILGTQTSINGSVWFE